MPTLARELQVYPYIPSLLETFGAGPSGGKVLVPARTLRRSRLKGRCRQSRPLENPPAAPPEVIKIFRIAMGGFIENSLKNMVSLRTSL